MMMSKRNTLNTLVLIVLTAAGVRAQVSQPETLPTVSGPQVSIVRGPNDKSPRTVQGGIRPVLGLKTNMPVQVKGEFKPETVAAGGTTHYVLSVSALPNVIRVPEAIPMVPSAAVRMEDWIEGQTYHREPRRVVAVPLTLIHYEVKPQVPGVYQMPGFDITVRNETMHVPALDLRVTPAGSPGAIHAPRIILQAPERTFVAQSVPVQLLIPDLSSTMRAVDFREFELGGHSMICPPLFRRAAGVTQLGEDTVHGVVLSGRVIPLQRGRLAMKARALVVFRDGAAKPKRAQQNLFAFSEVIHLNVESLPETGMLPGFTGAIGAFNLSNPVLSTNRVVVGEPFTLTVTLSGAGNFGRFEPPSVPPCRGLRSYPASEEVLPNSEKQIPSRVIYSYTLVPLHTRVAATPPIPFASFDPEKEVYVDRTLPPMQITVGAAPDGATRASERRPVPWVDPRKAGLRDERLLYLSGIAEKPGRRHRTFTPLHRRRGFLLLQGVFAIGLCGLWLRFCRIRHLEAHPEMALLRHARKAAGRQALLARRAARSGDSKGFVLHAVSTLREAAAPHANAQPEALACEDVLAVLRSGGADEKANETVHHLFRVANAARFGSMDLPQEDTKEWNNRWNLVYRTLMKHTCDRD